MSLTDDFLKGMQERNLVVQKDTNSKKKKKGAWYETATGADDITTEFLQGMSTYKPGRDDIIAPVRTTRVSDIGFVAPTVTVTSDVAPVRNPANPYDRMRAKGEDEWYKEKDLGKKLLSGWFQKGEFEDGYDFGDVTKTILGTTADVGQDLLAGVIGAAEKGVDFLAANAGNIARGMYYANGGGYNIEADSAFNFAIDSSEPVLEEFTKKNIIDEEKISKTIVSGDYEEKSVLGAKADQTVQSGGQLLASAGLQAVGVPWFITTGATAWGGEAENALNQGATLDEANFSGLVSAGAEILTEKLSGGIKFGGKALDDALTDQIARGISNKFLRKAAKLGLDAFGEGAEEWISQDISTFGQWLSYRDEEELKELLFSEEAMDEKIDAFFGGALLGGVSNVSNAVKSSVQGVDSVSGLTTEEEALVRKTYDGLVEEAEKNGKLSSREKTKIYDQVVDDLKNGKLSTEAADSPVVEETDNSTDLESNPLVSSGDNNIADTSTGYSNGEYYNTMTYTQDGKVVATLEYGDHDGTPNVKMIEVDPEYRRQGIGTKLLQALQKKYPDVEIDFGMTTPDGTKLLEKATYQVENADVAQKKARIEEIQKKLAEYDEGIENYVQNDMDVPEDYASDYNDLYDEMQVLEDEVRGKSTTKTFVKTDDLEQTPALENPSAPVVEESSAPVSPELQSLYDKRQALQDTIMARYNDGLYNEETENLAKQWDIVNRQIADMESAQKSLTAEQTTVQQEQREPTTTEKVQKHFRDEVLDYDKIFESDTPENVAKFNAVSNATEVAQDFISKGTEGVKSIPDIFGKISEIGELDNFESYLRHRLNVDRSTLEQRYGSEVPNRPVFSDYTAEQSQKIADDLERAHPEFKQAAEDVYAFNNYLLDLRVKAGRVTQEWADRWRESYPHYVPLSRSRHGDGQVYSILLDMIQGKPLDTSDSGAIESFLGEVDTAAEVHKITSSGNDFNPLIDTMVNQAFTVYWDLAANQPGSIVAPTVADSGIQSAPLVNDTTETEQAQPEVDSVNIETEVPAESNLTEYDPHNLMDNKKGVGKVIQAVTDAFEVYVLDDAIPFEKVAKKTGTSLDASFHATRNAFSSAQHFIGKGNEAQGVRALTDIVKDVDKTKAKEEFLTYLGHLRNIDGMSLHSRFGLANNQNFMGKNETFAKSNKAVRELESTHPEFKKLADDIYAYTDYIRNQFVERGMISQEDADLWKELYPHYVPMRFTGNGSVDSILETLAHYTTESFNTLAMNEFGVDLKNALQTEVAREPANILSFIQRLDSGDSLFLFGENGDHHTFSVYENGERVTYDITDEMYMALSDAHKWMDWKIPVLHQVNEGFRKFCTEWNIFFSLKNGVKDPQDIIYNSKHPLETYTHLVDAGTAIASKELGQQTKYSHYYEEYLANGGEPITFFDSQKGKFTSWTDPSELIQYVTGLKAVGAVNDRVEKLPRLAEYIASREAGRTVKEAMLDSAQVTTNFAAGGKFTKFLNRNGCTFLNASVQGALQHARNFANAATGADGKLHFDTKEAKVAAVKGVASLIARGVAVGMATIAINDLRWKDDEEYEQLPDYVKEGYYLLFKFGDGQFFRLPKGRTNATVEEGIRQVAKESFGNDEADWDKFWQIFFENIAPNNPLTNNIFAPIREVAEGKTWYGEDLIPRRLQEEDTVDQYDEKTDRLSVGLSKWLDENIDGTAIEEWLSDTGYGDGLSPKEINYLINSYTGVLGDLVLPHFTPKAETSSDNPFVQALAPLKDIFTTDSVLNNKLTGEFYETLESVEAKAESEGATPEDKLKSGILIGYNVEISDLMKEQREIQNSDMPDSEKYQRTRELKKEINALQEEALGLLEDYEIDGNYAESGDKRYNYDAKGGTWWEVKPELANGKPNPYYVQEQLSHDKLGLSYADFWNGKRPSPDFEGKTYYAEYNGKRYNYDVEDNSWYEIKAKKKNGDDNYYYQQEQIAHDKLGISYEDFWNNREAYMDAIYVAKNGVEYGWGTPYYETVKTAIGLDSFTEIASDMANIKGDSRYDDMNKYIYSLDIPEAQKHILFKAEYPKTNKYNHEIIDYLNEREDISYEQMESILKELGFEVDSKGHITW